MDSNSSKLEQFEDAMKAVYGPFDSISPERISEWSPPENPGAGGHRGRYLWTDAFGVVNFITLSREKGPPTVYLGLAERLVQTVHDVLGRTRDGSARLPGATEERPLGGGLRIGKIDASGPDGDGQYHHYLTLWMFALNRLSLATGEARYNDLAIQLAKAIHPRFVFAVPMPVPGRGKGRAAATEAETETTMVWKISADMRRVLVASKGHLDDVTGMAVFRILQETARKQQRDQRPPEQPAPLESEIEQYQRMVDRSRPLRSSHDPLDLGMSLWISHFERDAAWSRELAADGLDLARKRFLPNSTIDTVAADRRRRRLAFRDFGACLGIKCYGGDDESLVSGADVVAAAWMSSLDEGGPDLRPISAVMGPAALIPGAFRQGYLGM